MKKLKKELAETTDHVGQARALSDRLTGEKTQLECQVKAHTLQIEDLIKNQRQGMGLYAGLGPDVCPTCGGPADGSGTKGDDAEGDKGKGKLDAEGNALHKKVMSIKEAAFHEAEAEHQRLMARELQVEALARAKALAAKLPLSVRVSLGWDPMAGDDLAARVPEDELGYDWWATYDLPVVTRRGRSSAEYSMITALLEAGMPLAKMVQVR